MRATKRLGKEIKKIGKELQRKKSVLFGAVRSGRGTLIQKTGGLRTSLRKLVNRGRHSLS